MKSKTYLSLLVASFTLLPILFILFCTWLPNSNYYYISNFSEHRVLFEEAVELRLKDVDKNRYQIIQKELLDTCRVDAIDMYINNENIYVSFLMSDSSFYPSNEYKYRMIIYQPNNELPEFLDKYYNIAISENWFYVTNSFESLCIFFLILAFALFILSVWITGIISICKKLKRRK